jgi:tryptophan synthase alpha chain|uniref:tryptophan synthase subunit alpha n=1 Tax=Catenibacterium mitsuokai TaxID=100886 RepID=UPI003D7769AF
MVELVCEVTDVPEAVEFEISTPEQAKKMASQSDGAIVGSAIIKIIEKYGKNAPQYVEAYVKEMIDVLK